MTLQGLVFQLDIALESLETQRNGIIFIYDMTESKYSNFDYELSVKILHLLKVSRDQRGYSSRLRVGRGRNAKTKKAVLQMDGRTDR